MMNMDLDALLEKISKQPAVLVTEEFGRNEWLYFPSFPLTEMEQRWVDLESIESVRDYSEILSGEWISLPDEFDGDERSTHKTIEILDRAISKAYGSLPYDIHICCDIDSVLYTPNGEAVHHKGLDLTDYDFRPENIIRAKFRLKKWQKEQANEP